MSPSWVTATTSSDQLLSRRQVLDHGNLAQHSLHRGAQLVRHLDKLDGVMGFGRKWPLLTPLGLDHPAEQQTGTS